MNEKTCNCSGYCAFKVIGSSNAMCSNTGECDYQAPKGAGYYTLPQTGIDTQRIVDKLDEIIALLKEKGK